MQKEASFSFIIPSTDRLIYLEKCISSIEIAYETAKRPNIEIIVIFNCGQRSSLSMGSEYRHLTRLYYVKEGGLAAARNFGIKQSNGDFLVFLDDDAAIKEDFLVVLSKNVSAIKVEAFCGRIVDPVKNQFYSECFLDNKYKFLNRFKFMYFMGSAHVLKKSTIEHTGFYDEDFGAGAKYPAAEESDLFFRIKQQGGKVAYLPELIFHHPINDTTSVFKRFNYSYAVGAMLTKQIFLDGKNFFIYIIILSGIVFKSFLRTLQTIFFLKSIEVKNRRFQYKSILMGTLKGVGDYIRGMNHK